MYQIRSYRKSRSIIVVSLQKVRGFDYHNRPSVVYVNWRVPVDVACCLFVYLGVLVFIQSWLEQIDLPSKTDFLVNNKGMKLDSEAHLRHSKPVYICVHRR